MPVEPTSERLRRILVLVPWVLAHGSPTVAEVCDRFGISEGELSDDLALLFCCGLPPFGPGDLIYAEIVGDRVEIDMADYFSKPPRLTKTEAAMMLVMGRAVASLPGMEDADALRSALDKLRAAIAPTDAADAEDAADRVQVMFGGASDGMLARLRDAIGRRDRLHIEYYTAGRDVMTERDVDPLLVYHSRGEWYLIAHDHHSDEQRQFRIDRIRAAEATGVTFEPIEVVDPSRYLGDLVFTGSERDLDVVLELSPAAAWVREVVPHDAATPARDGTIRMRLRTSRPEWLVSLMLTLGAAARAVEPAALVEAIREGASRALARYDQA